MTVNEKLLSFICENFMVEPDEIDMDASLVDQGIIDSFGLVEISAFLKNMYDISIDSTDMNRQNFGSVNKIIAFTEGRKA